MFYLFIFYYVNYYLTLLTKQRSPLVQCQHIALAHEWRNYGECLTKMWVSTRGALRDLPGDVGIFYAKWNIRFMAVH